MMTWNDLAWLVLTIGLAVLAHRAWVQAGRPAITMSSWRRAKPEEDRAVAGVRKLREIEPAVDLANPPVDAKPRGGRHRASNADQLHNPPPVDPWGTIGGRQRATWARTSGEWAIVLQAKNQAAQNAGQAVSA